MVESERTPPSRFRAILIATLWIAIVTGLVEAGGSMLLMRLGRRPGAWWDLFWVSPLFDIVLFGLTGVALTFVARTLKRPAFPIILPVYGFLTASIWLGLALPYQVHIAALLALSAGLGIQGARLIVRRLDRVLTFWSRTLPYVGAAAVVALLAVVAGRPLRERVQIAGLPAADDGAPDVVLIVVDALRADHLTTHGYARDTSPNLARLAAEGASFRAAFSASPYTAPSHASLLTGLYPSEHGVQWIERRPVLAEEHGTIGEAFQALGYRTAAVSGNRFWFTREQRYGRGFHRFRDNYHAVGDAIVRTAYGRKLDEWVIPRLFEDYPWRLKADQVTDAALEWADGGERPFFLMLNYFDVHDPYFPPDPYRAWFSDKTAPGGILNTYLERYHPDLTAEQLQDEIDAYDGSIRYVDAEIGRLLEALRPRPSDRDLLIVVTSDHGEAFGEHGTYIHANSLYLEEIYVPLMLWSPGRVPEGFRSDVPVSHAAIPATLMDLVDGGGQHGFGVPSLTSLWSGDVEVDAREAAFSEMERWDWNLETSPSHYGQIQAAILADDHLIVNDSLGVELYRWREDPREATDLAETDSSKATVTRLQGAIRRRLPALAAPGAR
jgi:arylsulfatase A-like enzyme